MLEEFLSKIMEIDNNPNPIHHANPISMEKKLDIDDDDNKVIPGRFILERNRPENGRQTINIFQKGLTTFFNCSKIIRFSSQIS